MCNWMMNTRRGLHQLYAEFGAREFTGDRLRAVMIQVMGGSSQPRVGWVASTHLGRLVKSGVVELVKRNPDAKASWGHTYQITSKGLTHLGVDDPSDGEGSGYDGSESPEYMDLEQSLAEALKILGQLKVKGLRYRVSKATGVLYNEDQPSCRWNGLRIALVSGWIDLSVSITSEGQQWLKEQSETEGKA